MIAKTAAPNVSEPTLTANDDRPADHAVADGGDEAVVGAAVLVATAFRLRDEDALITSLRLLCDSVGELEAANDDEPPST